MGGKPLLEQLALQIAFVGIAVGGLVEHGKVVSEHSGVGSQRQINGV